jgi:hypothetical protein
MFGITLLMKSCVSSPSILTCVPTNTRARISHLTKSPSGTLPALTHSPRRLVPSPAARRLMVRTGIWVFFVFLAPVTMGLELRIGISVVLMWRVARLLLRLLRRSRGSASITLRFVTKNCEKELFRFFLKHILSQSSYLQRLNLSCLYVVSSR